MAISVVATDVVLNGPDAVALSYELRDGATLVDTGTVYFRMPYDDTLTANQRKAVLIDLVKGAIKERVHGLQGIQNDFAAFRTAVLAGQVHFP